MTCEDCLHYDVCDMPIITDGRKNASNCKKFKNKADFVEVVRCGNCLNRIKGTYPKCAGRKLDDYCSDGVRKE